MFYTPRVTQLYLYPFKSCQAVSVDSAIVGPRGFELGGGKIVDRSWMVVDAEGRLISQREKPELARVAVELVGRDNKRVDDNGLARKIQLSAIGHEPIILDSDLTSQDSRLVSIHNRITRGYIAPKNISEWFKDFLHMSDATVVHQKADDDRLSDSNKNSLSFADGYPYHIVTEATLGRLNQALVSPIPMNRFRPNIVIGDTPQGDEYGWSRIALGAASMWLVKPCARCVMTTIDQETGVRMGTEPLATLSRAYSLSQELSGKNAKMVIFGENAIPDELDVRIYTDDLVHVLERKAPHPFNGGKASLIL